MNTDNVRAGSGEHMRLLDELESLLNDQVAMARTRNFDTFEELAEKSGRIVDELGRAGALRSADLKERFERLVKSYRTAILSVAAEKDNLEKQLQQIGRGRKTLRMYRAIG